VGTALTSLFGSPGGFGSRCDPGAGQASTAGCSRRPTLTRVPWHTARQPSSLPARVVAGQNAYFRGRGPESQHARRRDHRGHSRSLRRPAVRGNRTARFGDQYPAVQPQICSAGGVSVWGRQRRHACHGGAHRSRHGSERDQHFVRGMHSGGLALADRALGAFPISAGTPHHLHRDHT
jgi:hypothetical protein